MSQTGICSLSALVVASQLAMPAAAAGQRAAQVGHPGQHAATPDPTPAEQSSAPAMQPVAEAPATGPVETGAVENGEDYGSVFDQRFAQGEQRYGSGEFERAALLWWGVTEVYPDMAYAQRERFAAAAIGAWLAAYRSSGAFHFIESAERAWNAHATVTGTLGTPSAVMAALRAEIDAAKTPAVAVVPQPAIEPAQPASLDKAPEKATPVPGAQASSAEEGGASEATAIHGGDRRRTRGAVLTLLGGTSMLIGSVLVARAPARLREVEQNIQFAHFAQPRGWKPTRAEERELDDARRHQTGLRGVGWTSIGAGLGVFVWGVIELSVLKRRSADTTSPATARRRHMRVQPSLSRTVEGDRSLSLSWSGRF